MTMDWQELCAPDQAKLMAQPARIEDIRFQALIEGAIGYYAHAKLWQEAPKWTKKTKLKDIFVPRAAVREIGNRRFDRLTQRCAAEFIEKNVLFTYDEMAVI